MVVMMDGIVLLGIFAIFLHLSDCSKIAGTCKGGSKVYSIKYRDAIVNYTLVGPVMSSITAKNERECEMECHLAVPDKCYMFNYHPSSKVCELLYKERAADYKVEKKKGSTFKTRKCDSSPCQNEGKCFLLGEQKNKACHCNPSFTGPRCETFICKTDPNVPVINYTRSFSNHSITGPVLRSLTTINEMACECTCQMTAHGLCHMFNFNPTNKSCELFFEDRAAEYSVVEKAGSLFKTRKCATEPPCFRGRCYSLGDHNSNLCLCDFGYSGKHCHVYETGIKVNTNPVCIGAKDDTFGTFVAPFNGKVKTFRLVHLSGGVSHSFLADTQGKWGAKEFTFLISYNPSKIELHVTHPNKARITPPVGYPLYMEWGRMGWDMAGYNYNSPELVFPEISPITVTKGQTFNIWYGQDYTGSTEHDNQGTTCANVYMLYTE